MSWYLASFYKFTTLLDIPTLRDDLMKRGADLGVYGTILLAEEGINAGIAAPETQAREAMLAAINEAIDLGDGLITYGQSDTRPYGKLKIEHKDEIITTRLGVWANPGREAGQYVSPEDWNALIRKPHVTLIDTRNDYETRTGTFQGALDPGLSTFTDFIDYVDTHLDPERDWHVAMFCTGGIRCEKASSYMRQKGFKNVYHLQGGILRYLEDIPPGKSLWQGECFVFDKRVTVTYGLEPGTYKMCYNCRMPVSGTEQTDTRFEPGVSCPHCYDKLDTKRASDLRRRYHQFLKEVES
jgi:UPF0176 protein